ncbi:MAG: cation transporter [Clostridia bacterium]|nr:cation transporter [Clostridia bacterium]
MKTEKNILIAFLLNIVFSIFEFIGGAISGSVAIMSDAVHDLGDATSIGISYFLEKKSKKKPDEKYTYGYIRYSVIGSIITTTILIVGSVLVIFESIKRIINPVEIDYSKMIIFAIFGVVINFIAAYVTKEGDSLNQKSVNLHMLEDVLGWVVVLIGAVIMKFTDISLIDPILSIGVAVFILINAIKNLKTVIDLFLEKTPKEIDISEIKEHLIKIDNVIDVHHIHIWSIDGYENLATMHIVANSFDKEIKHKIKEELKEHGINHSTIEFESVNECCDEEECEINHSNNEMHHHHHHHHH